MKKDTIALIAGIVAFLIGYFTDPKAVNVFNESTTMAILMVLKIGGGILALIGGGSVARRTLSE